MSKAASPSSMESEIWKRLPPELLEKILILLPPKSFYKLRTTCKHFNSLLFSPSFITKHSSSPTNQTHSSPPPPPPFSSSFLLLSHPQLHHQFPLYDSILSHWRMKSLSLSLTSSFSSANLHSSSNGILCFSLPNSSSFFIHNPLSKSSRVIDFPINPFDFRSVTLITSSQGQGYKIFVLSSGWSSPNSAFIFDSELNSWSQFSISNRILEENSDREGVFFNAYLYFMTLDQFSITGFGFEKEKWEILIGELPNERLTFARLVNSGDGKKLYLVGGIVRNRILRSMKLWELREGERNWVEIVRVPEMMCRKLLSVCCNNHPDHIYCLYHDGMICVCSYTWPGVLYYKLSWQTWHWLPKCPSLTLECYSDFRCFSFVPNLYALV